MKNGYNEYIEVNTSKGTLWKLKKEGDRINNEDQNEESIEHMEEFARRGDVVAMVVFLGSVVLINSATIAACISILAMTSISRANPSISRTWLLDEVAALFWMICTLVTCAQIAIISVHARIGRLIASG